MGKKEFIVKHSNLVSLCAAVVITGAGVSIPGTPAFAKNTRIVVVAPSANVTRRISYADLDLASTVGHNLLQTRVRGGIRSLCTEVGGSYESERANCTDHAWSQANPQMIRAEQRARDFASTSTSTVAAAAITISLP